MAVVVFFVFFAFAIPMFATVLGSPFLWHVWILQPARSPRQILTTNQPNTKQCDAQSSAISDTLQFPMLSRSKGEI